MRRPIPYRVLIFLIVFCVFARLCTAEFTWYDDAQNIHQNPRMNPPTIGSIAPYWWEVGWRAPLGLYIPLTYTFWGIIAKASYMGSADVSGIRMNPWIFHIANVLLHSWSALLVFAIFRQLQFKPSAAAAGALLFGLHPIQVEAVGWIAGGKDLLCAFFVLLTILTYLHYRQAESTRRRAIYLSLSLISFIASMLSKPTGMVTPVILLTVDVLILRTILTESVIRMLPWFFLSAICAVSARIAQRVSLMPAVPGWFRALVPLDSLGFYIGKLIVPVGFAPDYGRTPSRLYAHPAMWWMMAVPILLGIVFWQWRRTKPVYLAGGIITAAGVLPVLGYAPFQFQQFSTVADHYFYFAMLGPALIVAHLLSQYSQKMVHIIAGLLLGTLAALSIYQTGFWQEDLTLWTHNIEVNPASFMAYTNRGVTFLNQRRFALAESDLRRALELAPNFAIVHFNLGNVLLQTGRNEEALARFRSAYELDPSLIDAKIQITQLQSTKPPPTSPSSP